MTGEGEGSPRGSSSSRRVSDRLFWGSNSLKMRQVRGVKREREEEREIVFESEGRTGVRGKVGVPNRGVGG